MEYDRNVNSLPIEAPPYAFPEDFTLGESRRCAYKIMQPFLSDARHMDTLLAILIHSGSGTGSNTRTLFLSPWSADLTAGSSAGLLSPLRRTSRVMITLTLKRMI